MLKGIEINHYKTVDFSRISVDFVVIAATEGTGYTDPTLSLLKKESRIKGLLIGYYHFARPDKGNTPEAEAEYFLNAIGSLEAGEVLCLDYEVVYGAPVVWCKAWLDHIYRLTGVKPLIYLNKSLQSGNNWGSVVTAGYGLWLADYTYNPNTTVPATQWPVVAMRQYSNNDIVEGVTQVVDANVFYGDSKTFHAYGYQAITPIPPVTTDPCTEITQELIDMRASRDKWKNNYNDLLESSAKAQHDLQVHVESLQSSQAEMNLQLISSNKQLQLSTDERDKLSKALEELNKVYKNSMYDNVKTIDSLSTTNKSQANKLIALQNELDITKAKLTLGLKGYTKAQLFWYILGL